MRDLPAKKELVVLTACGHGEYAMRGVFSRHSSLGIRAVTPDYFVHPAKDPGVFKQAHEFLRPFIRTHGHAIVLLDSEGSGKEAKLKRTEMEADQIKPRRPKEALLAALRLVKKPQSSSLYRELAEKVSLNRCTDAAFEKLKETLQRWFGH